MAFARWVSFSMVAGATAAAGQQRPEPVIDMHLHASSARSQGPPPIPLCIPLDLSGIVQGDSETVTQAFLRIMRNGPLCSNPILSPATDDELRERTLRILEARNVIAVTSGTVPFVERWGRDAPDRIIPGLSFNVAQSRISPDSLRRLFQSGVIKVFGEVTNQYSGIGPSDSLFEPYLAVAEEVGMPVGIHIGTGPPGAPYFPGMGHYRARLHSPLLLEEALVRHPRLRVYIMHAGWPMLDDLLAVLYAHPQVFVDVGVIVWNLPDAEFYRYLRTVVEAGFGGRVMFGSDQMVWPETIDRGIQRIEKAPFLSEAQKRDILYNNAARFLRLTPEQIAKHHGR
jgi:predicted TIM-barrel fold metal-dependent hydrolase